MKRIIAVFLCFLPLVTVSSQELVFGTYPFGDSARIYRAFSPLVAHLAEETGRPMRLVVTRDYAELSDRLVDGSVDLAWIGSANYIVTRERLPTMRYLATYLERSVPAGTVQPYYQSVIVALRDEGYEELEDLAGTRFGFTSPDSTSGYAYPSMMLDAAGIEPSQFFSEVFFLGRHTDVIAALQADSLDAGAVSDGTYYNAREEYGDAFSVLAWSDPIPLDAVVAGPGLDDALAGEIQSVLVAINESHPVNESVRAHLGWPAAGFEIRSDSFYDSVEAALRYTASQ